MATYAFPMNGSATHASHGHGQIGTQHRKAAPERISLRPTSMIDLNSGNESSPWNGRFESAPPPHENAQVRPSRSLDNTRNAFHHHLHSSNNLPFPTLDPIKSENVTPIEMDHEFGIPSTHLRAQEDGYGFFPNTKHQRAVSSAVHTPPRPTTTKTEIVSALLVPLPYVLMALFNPTAATQQKLQQSSPVESAAVNHARLVLDDSVEVHAFDAVPRPGFLSACALTSMTLLIVGAVGKLQKKPTTRGRSGSALGPRGEVAKNQAQVLSAVGARRILARTASIGLPFYAAEKLGGDRVGLVTLVTLAADLMNVESEGINLTTVEGWKRVLAFRRWTLAVLSVQVFCDVFGITNNIEMTSAWMGYLALALSVFAFPPPFLTTKLKKSSASTEGSASTGKISESTDASWKDSLAALGISLSNVRASPILSTPGDVQLTLASGVAVAGLLLLFLLFPQYSASPFFIRSFGSVDIVAPCALALSILTAQPQALRSEKKIGLVVGSFVSIVLPKFFGSTSWIPFACQGVFLVAFWLATTSDTHLQFSNLARPQQHPGKPQHEHSDKNSRLTEFLLYTFRDWPLWHSIISERDSRRIFYFMSLNFAFMLVQFFYGFASGSLGLLSDSIHMLFDCLALAVGLCAAVMSKWPPSMRFPYGYGKIDTLAGFANGIFLMLISVEIIYEAIERLTEGKSMQRIEELLTVSTLGLIVNLVGIAAFGHAHHGHGHDHSHDEHNHSHEGHDHSHNGHDHTHPNHSHDPHSTHHDHNHSHQNHDHEHEYKESPNYLQTPDSAPFFTPLSASIPPTPSKPSHHHNHGHHHHHHDNSNMHGIFLHILADTLGSVAVVISTLLIHFFGWSGFDPLASCLIAILIFASAIPLVTSSAKTLLLSVPEDTEFDLREALAGISGLRGVSGYTVPRFWLEDTAGGGRRVMGVVHVFAGRGAGELEEVKGRVEAFLQGRNLNVLIQMEREGEGRCWCCGGNR